MPTDFSSAGRSAGDMIAVPDAPLDIVRSRARTANARARATLAASLAAVVLLGVGVGTGVAQRAYQGIRIWVSGSQAEVQIGSFMMITDPMASDVRDVVRRAAFNAILPGGIPSGARIAHLMYSPADHPTTITLDYRHRGGMFGVTLVKTDSIERAPLPGGGMRSNVVTFRVGEQTVVLTKSAHVPASLRWDTAAQGEAAAEHASAPIRILGAQSYMADAERLHPPDGSVLVGPQFVLQLPEMARANEPLRDTRILLLTDIPMANGGPDYMHATYHWSKTVAADARSVRALAGALHANPCKCAMMIAPSNAGYRIWQLAAGRSPRTFTVKVK